MLGLSIPGDIEEGGENDTAASPSTRMRSMDRLVKMFRKVAGETSMMSFADLKKIADIKTDRFASRLFKAIDKDRNGFITCEEFVEFLYTLECHNLRGRLQILFDLYDMDGSGRLSIHDLECILMESVCESNANMDKSLVAYLAKSIVDAFDSDASGDISFEEFALAMSQYPDIAAGLTIQGPGLCTNDCSVDEGIWPYIKCKFRSHYNLMINNTERAISCVVLFIVLASAFCWRASLYTQGPKYDLMGWTLPVAKGCGQMIKVIYALILFPVSRHFMTRIRKTPLRYIFPVDDAIDFHKILGTLAFLFAWTHTLCHVQDIRRWGDPRRFEIWKRAFPDESVQPTTAEIATSLVGVTGILQILLFTIVFVTASNWPRRSDWMKNSVIGKVMNNFNFIWYAHHLVIVMLVLVLFHPMPHIPDEKNEWGYSDTWVWIGIPLAVYLLERLLRLLRRFKSVELISAEILPGKVIALKLSKPKGIVFKTGMYIYLNNPGIAEFEWHPFSLTSPTDADHLSVHIKVCGDWTEALYNRVKECTGVALRDTNGKELLVRLAAAQPIPTGQHPDGSQDCSSPIIWKSPALSIQGDGNQEHGRINALCNGMINNNFVPLPESLTGKPISPRPNNSPRKPLQEYQGGWNACPVSLQQSPRAYMTSMMYMHPAKNNASRRDSFAVDLSHLPASPRPVGKAKANLGFRIDGPFGAPIQGFKEHSVLLLVGAGIGVTPFAGILSDLVYRIRKSNVLDENETNGSILGLPKLRKVYFYWSIRTQREVIWFSRLLEAISKDDTLGLLDINVHLTCLKDTKDVRTALLKLVQVSMHVATGVDVMSGLKTRILTHFGRPCWKSVFQQIREKHPKQKIGVFYSGPNTLAKILRDLSQENSTKGVRFKFVKEAFGHW